jgi:hypothetical protein
VFICVHLWQKFGLDGLYHRTNLKMVTFGHVWSHSAKVGDVEACVWPDYPLVKHKADFVS